MRPRLTFVPTGGLGNRIRALDAAIRLTASCDASIRVLWFRDWQCPCSFQKLFSFVRFTEDELPFPHDFHCIEAAGWRYFGYERPRKENLYLPFGFQLFRFDRRMYENEVPRRMEKAFDFAGWLRQGREVYLGSYDAFMGECPGRMLPWFVPSAKVEAEIAPLAAEFSGRMIGLHIRRTDNLRSIDVSPTDLFIRRMERLLAEDPSTRFFLATDSVAEREMLMSAFGRDRFVVPDYAPGRASVVDIRRALAEMYLLSRCDFVIGSFWSSFSKVAASLGGKSFELLHKDAENDR